MQWPKRGALAAAVALTVAAVSPLAATAAITPDPFLTRSGTGGIVLSTVYGISRCALSSVIVQANGTATGATGSVAGFPAATCAGGIVTGAAYAGPMTFTVASGSASVNYVSDKTTVIGGRCRYAGTLTGSIAKGASSFTVSGRPTLVATLRGICEPGYLTTLTLDLPGAAITW